MHNPFLKRFREFILAPSHSRTISAVVILIIAAAVPLTVLVAQQQQEVRQHAAGSCTVSNCSGQSGPMCNGTTCQTQGKTCSQSTTICGANGVPCCVSEWSLGSAAPGQCGSVTCTTANCGQTVAGDCGTTKTCPACGASPTPTTSTSPTPTPNSGGITGSVTPYCGIPNTSTSGMPPGITVPPPGSVNDANVSSAFFTWTRPTSGNYVYLTYTATGFASDTYLAGTSNSFYAPRAAGSTFPRPNGTNITYTQCTATDQSGTTFACGFVSGATVNWTLNECSGTTGASCSTIKSTWSGSFTAATCPTAQCTNGTTQCSPTGVPQTCTNGTWVNGTACATGQTCTNGTCGAPVCTLSANPSSVPLSGTSSLLATCTGTNANTTYTWSSTTCGTVTQANSASTTWTGPNSNAITSCPVSVQVCNGTACVTPTTTITVAVPNCGTLTANPSTVNVNGTSTLSIICTNTTTSTTYNWTSSCGNTASAVTQTGDTTWTAPATGPTSCTETVLVCSNGTVNANNCAAGSVIIPVTIPDCNATPTPTSACVATNSNTCSANNGTQTAHYTTFNGSTMCNPVNITQTCTISSCNAGNVCTNGQCLSQASPTPTATPVCSGSTPNSCNGQCTNTQTDNNNCGACGVVCASGQVCNNGNCTSSCTAPNTTCNGVCTNTQTDSNNCGTCGNACIAGQVCTNGTCGLIPGHTYIALRIGMDAIGSVGDNENPNPSSSNQNPLTTKRNLAVQIFDSNNNQVVSPIGSINYNSTSGVFLGTIDLGANFANGNYTIKVKSDGHLKRLIPGIQNLSSSLTQPIQLPGVNLVAGDIDTSGNSNNALTISDYNILLSCVTSPIIANIDNHALCNTNANYVKLSDLEDNGVVNEFDYNLFLREYAVQNGD